jgi:putative OPT family oligopeptide transporter
MKASKYNFKPFVNSSSKLPEFTFRAILLGGLLGLIFGVGNAYLGLKVGTTVSASIPAAVMSMAILRIFSKNVSILENNMVQTIASVGEGLAAGVIFTIPALFLLDEAPSFSRIVLLSLTGGILGILFMIPMRRYIIVEEHHKIPFPEGTACFEILKTGSSAKSKALTAVVGIALGSIYKVLSQGFSLFKETASWKFSGIEKTSFSIDCTPALLGVGYIIGPRVASFLLFGGVLGWGVLIPLIAMMGQGNAIIYPGTVPVNTMSPDDIWSNYIRYIGCGTVAVGGIVSLLKIIPLIKKTVSIGFKELFQKAEEHQKKPRIDRDISLKWLILGSIAIILFLWLNPDLPMNFLTILLLTILGFFFVAVTSITVGVVGSTSNPVSGMTIVTLLLTCLIFVALGWTERVYLISAITMSVVVNIAIALAATTSQDLKTGFLVGATPKWQQIGEMIGIIIPACAIAVTIYLLDAAYGFGSNDLPAPQGTLIALLAKGVITGNVPFNLVLIGAVIGLLLALLQIPILPVAIGLYLPLSLSTSTMLGSIIPFLLKKFNASEDAKERGILAASGLIAGDACTGVILALLIVIGKATLSDSSIFSDKISLLSYLALAFILYMICVKPPKVLEK